MTSGCWTRLLILAVAGVSMAFSAYQQTEALGRGAPANMGPKLGPVPGEELSPGGVSSGWPAAGARAEAVSPLRQSAPQPQPIDLNAERKASIPAKPKSTKLSSHVEELVGV